MKKMNLHSKLQLRRETVRILTVADLQNVVGGRRNTGEEPESVKEVCSYADDGNHCGTKRH